MTSAQPNDTSLMDGPPAEAVEVGIYQSSAEGFEHGLVALALGQPYWLMPSENGYRLLVERSAYETVREQLDLFDRESAGWPPPTDPDPAPLAPLELLMPLLWSAVVLLAFRAQQSSPGFTRAGVLDAHDVLSRGEWWRAATALFLHADAEHLVSNALSGVAVFAAVLSTFGRMRGWLLIAAAGVGGNFAAALMNLHRDYQSLGASTAIFGGLGLLTGRAIRIMSRTAHPHRWRSMFVPFAAGVTVLGLFGAGGVHIDVIAHATGFVAGLIFGMIAAPKRSSRPNLNAPLPAP